MIKYQNGIIFKPIWKKVKYVYSTTAYVRSCILPNQQLVPFLDKSIFLPCPIQFNVSMLDSATIYFLDQCCYCKATPLFWDLVMWFLRSECQWIDPCHQEADRETLILPVHMLRKTVGGSDVKRWKNILLTSQKKHSIHSKPLSSADMSDQHLWGQWRRLLDKYYHYECIHVKKSIGIVLWLW